MELSENMTCASKLAIANFKFAVKELEVPTGGDFEIPIFPGADAGPSSCLEACCRLAHMRATPGMKILPRGATKVVDGCEWPEYIFVLTDNHSRLV